MLKFVSRLLSLSFLLFLVSSLVYPVFASEKETLSVTVVGKASLEASTREKAEKIALKNAFQRAIEQGLGTFVRSGTEIADFELKKIKPEEYILSHKILRQWDTDDGKTVNVKIRAVVSLKPIGDDFRTRLKHTQAQIGKPVIAFTLTAWRLPEATGIEVIAPVLTKIDPQALIDRFQQEFTSLGFKTIVAETAINEARDRTEKYIQVASESRQTIAKKAMLDGANFFVNGEFKATYDGRDPATGTYKWAGTISCEIRDAAGEIVASYSETLFEKTITEDFGSTDLMNSAAKNAARVLAKQTDETYKDRAESGSSMYKIVLIGYKNFKEKRVIRNSLDKFIEIRGQSENRDKKEVSINADFKGSATELSKKIEEAMKENGFKENDFDVSITGNVVTIEL